MYQTPKDTKLLSRLSFEEIYDKYANDLIRTAYFYLKDKQKAEDVCQETFIKLITKQPILEDGREKTWLLTVTINSCKDILKSSWFKKTDLGDDHFLTIAAHENKKSELEEDLLIAISALPAKFKDVVLLHYYQGYGVNEISQILKISLGTVSSRLSRARQKLQKYLENLKYEQ